VFGLPRRRTRPASKAPFSPDFVVRWRKLFRPLPAVFGHHRITSMIGKLDLSSAPVQSPETYSARIEPFTGSAYHCPKTCRTRVRRRLFLGLAGARTLTKSAGGKIPSSIDFAAPGGVPSLHHDLPFGERARNSGGKRKERGFSKYRDGGFRFPASHTYRACCPNPCRNDLPADHQPETACRRPTDAFVQNVVSGSERPPTGLGCGGFDPGD